MELIIAFVFHCCYAVLIFADCPPPTVQNAAFTSVQTSYADGVTVSFTCNAGYEIDGRRIHTCRGSTWEGSLTCHEQFCETITTPRNGKIVGNPSYKIGTYITFECNTGYTLNGRTQLLCRVDLKFDGNPPTCDVKMCPDFGVIDHARIFQATDGGIENDSGSVVKVTCDDTYVLDGQAHVVCQADGTWGSKPTCKPLDCGRFDGMNSKCVKSFILFEALYYMECETDKPNTRIGGPSTSSPNECEEMSRQWMYSVFGCFCHCKVMFNQILVTTTNLTNDYLPHESVLQWSCMAGCTKSTTNALKCNDGQMEMPSCTCKDHVPTGEPNTSSSTVEPNTSSSTIEPYTSSSTNEPNMSSSTIEPYTSSSTNEPNTSSSTIEPNMSSSTIEPNRPAQLNLHSHAVNSPSSESSVVVTTICIYVVVILHLLSINNHATIYF